jgi:excisionase family DNA binding protein
VEKLLADLRDVTELTGIGKTRLYEEIAQGRLRTVRVGKRRLVTREALGNWVTLLESEAEVGQCL